MKLTFVRTPKTGKLNPKDAKIVSRELSKIQQEMSIITPRVVVDRAKSPNHPLHKYFEWEDGIAAEKYREWQARHLICSVYMIDSDSDNPQPIRAFANCSPEEDDDSFIADRGYVALKTISGRQNYELQLLEYAKQQLIGWRTRFGHYKEFFEVAESIDKVTRS